MLHGVRFNVKEAIMIKAVIFDMDGVLIDTEKHLKVCWIQAARELGYPFLEKHPLMLRSLAAEFARPLMKELFGEEFDFDKVRDRRKELMVKRLDEYGLEKKPGVDEILDFLRSVGIKTAVATATEPVAAREYLEKVGIYDKFNYVVSAHNVAHGKPMPDIYLYACEQIGEKPENCIAVEDSPNGVKAAASAGVKTVMVPDLTPADDEVKQLLFYYAENLVELKEYIKGLL